jgi:thymidylate kinase
VGRVPDRIERAGDGFHERVGEAYRLLAENESGIERLDGSLPTARVHEQVKRKLFRSFPETFAPGPG